MLKSENKYEDMIDIMEHVHKYVPAIRTSEEVIIPSTGEHVRTESVDFHPVIFGGDQLTVKRARGSQKIRSNSTDEAEKLEGLLPLAEDWHTKVCLLEVRLKVSP